MENDVTHGNREQFLIQVSKNALQFCSRIILVTGYRGNELHERYANQSNITIIHNPDYAQGLLTSVKAAVPAVQTEYCFLTHGDMPTLTIDIFSKNLVVTK